MPLHRLPLSRDHRHLRLQWARERRYRHAEWRNVVFLGESRVKMSYNDGRIRVRLYADERNLKSCILQRHRWPMPRVMVWGAIGYNMRSHFIRIEGNLNSNRYIRQVLQPKILPLVQATSHAIFQQDNVRPHSGEDCASLLPKTTGITASLACMFARHVTHRTCLGYGWSATYSSGSSSTYSWRFMNSHTNCVEGHSPGRYTGPLWFHATKHRDSDCSAWRLHTILISHAHRPCTVL